ncbi:MAG: hypothetical protein PHC61_00920 [Chitinivibrionales bacterium]|nr:hypothetical protein [Chitinivibrionales bacterium]
MVYSKKIEPSNLEGIDQWVENNRNVYLPAGIDTKDVVTEYIVIKDTLIIASVKQALRDQAVDVLGKNNIIPSSISVPLFDLAAWLSQSTPGSFFIWHIGDDSSRIALVHDGKLLQFCNFYAGNNAIKQDPATTSKQAEALMQSMSTETTVDKVIICNDGLRATPEIVLKGFSVTKAPQIEGLPERYLSAYACSLQKGSLNNQPDWAPFSSVSYMEKLKLGRKFATGVIRFGIAILLVCVVLGGLGWAGLFFASKKINETYLPLKQQLTTLANEQKLNKDALAQCGDIIRFSGRQSRLTAFLNQLQLMFPEGMKAMRISIMEADASHWHIDIHAQTTSSINISQFLSKANSLTGVEDMRMLYSERSGTKLDCKFGCYWKYKD